MKGLGRRGVLALAWATVAVGAEAQAGDQMAFWDPIIKQSGAKPE